jgi:hypothetical protein
MQHALSPDDLARRVFWVIVVGVCAFVSAAMVMIRVLSE